MHLVFSQSVEEEKNTFKLASILPRPLGPGAGRVMNFTIHFPFVKAMLQPKQAALLLVFYIKHNARQLR